MSLLLTIAAVVALAVLATWQAFGDPSLDAVKVLAVAALALGAVAGAALAARR